MTIHILYLASGSARRFGSNKLLYELDGKPMYRHGLDMLRTVAATRGDCTLTVVSRYEEIRQSANSMGLRAVDSPDSEKGISHTIRSGLSSLNERKNEDFILFVVADQPYLTAESVHRLLDTAKAGVEGACLSYGERPGNPTLFSARLVPELLSLEGDTGGRAVLKKHNCIFVQANSPRELEDIDTNVTKDLSL